jgi:L-fucose isomerase-like protein
MKELLSQNSAHAITIHCLGGVYSGKMVAAYPCLGFMQLDNEGLVGACEADQRSTMTKLIMTYLAGRPGFISDPVIDTAKNQIIYAHCVASTKVFGPEGISNPYHIRDHSEDRKGACNRSLMPLGEMTTTIQFDHHKKQIIMHQGVTVENVDLDRACRTKLAVEVKGDVYKLLDFWDQWGWHRVTFFGDFKRQVQQMAQLLKFEVIEEA